MKLEVYRQILEKNSGIKFHNSSSTGSRVVQCWPMDRQTDLPEEANSRFSQLCEKT